MPLTSGEEMEFWQASIRHIIKRFRNVESLDLQLILLGETWRRYCDVMMESLRQLGALPQHLHPWLESCRHIRPH